MEYIKRSLWQEIKMDIEANNHPFKLRYFLKYLFVNPEFQVLLSYRLQHRLFKMSAPSRILAKILHLITRAYSGCYIDYNARIEGGVRIVHSVGIIVGNSIIKKGVQILQHVTIASNTSVGENTILYTGVLISGGVKVGQDCIIGAYSIILKNVENNTKVLGFKRINIK